MMTGEHMPPHPELRNGPCQAAICNVQTCLRLHGFDEHDCQETISKYIDCAESHPEHYYVPTRSKAIQDVEEDAITP